MPRRVTTDDRIANYRAGTPRTALPRPPADRDRPLWPDGRRPAGRARPEHRRHRPAPHRQRAGRPGQAGLGGHGLPADRDRRHAALGQDLRPLWPPPHLPGRHHHLPGRLHALRPQPEPAAIDRLPRPARYRRRRPDGHRLQHHRGHHSPPRTRPLPGLLRRGLRRLQRGGAPARRLVHGGPGLALDLLRQSPGRHRRAGHHLAGADACRSCAASTRSISSARD